MDIKEFTEHPGVFHLIRSLKEDKIHEKEFSDLVDGEGNQYIELVQEGGGVLGVALLGYTYVLEQMGLRFFSLAGTSAGSINAMALAAFGDISRPKTEKIIEILVNKDLYDFVDGNDDSQDFIRALVEKAGAFRMAWKAWQVIDEIRHDLGLNPGDDFYNWMAGILDQNNVPTTRKLIEEFGKKPDGLMLRPGAQGTIDELNSRLAFIASDLTTETKVEFPLMRQLYWENPDDVHPARYVRASMSIPYFFIPMKVEPIPQGPAAMALWDDMVDYIGTIPEKVYFVDGGILSNFPIDVFHKKNSVPRLPTFGVRLGINRNEPNRIDNPLNLFGAMFNSIRHLHDYDFILRNPDYKHLVQNIDIGSHNWLNFGISDGDKKDLFHRGAIAASKFLRQFDWVEYKKIREAIKVPV